MNYIRRYQARGCFRIHKSEHFIEMYYPHGGSERGLALNMNTDNKFYRQLCGHLRTFYPQHYLNDSDRTTLFINDAVLKFETHNHMISYHQLSSSSNPVVTNYRRIPINNYEIVSLDFDGRTLYNY